MQRWLYNSSTGALTRDGKVACMGYSGWEQGRNSPEYEGIENIGPIPRGLYRIGAPYHHPKLGPYTFNLDPINHDARGRTAFRIHGDNDTHDASTGCVIAYRFARMALAFDVTENAEPIYLEVV